jgi:hypothetical protein
MREGAFHRYLGIKADKPIPLSRAMAALRSAKKRGSEKVRSMAQYAVNSIKSHKRS